MNESRPEAHSGVRPAKVAVGPLPRAYAALVFAYASVVAGVTLPTPLYVTFQDNWSLSNTAVTSLYALYPVGVLVVLLMAGHWGDLLGRRRVLRLAVVLSGASAIVFLLTNSPWGVAAARVLTGLASGCAVNAANGLMLELAPPASRRRASIASTLVNQVGIGCGALLSSVLVQYAWSPTRLPFAVHLVLLVASLAALGQLPESEGAAPKSTECPARFVRLRLPATGRVTYAAMCLAAFAAFALCGLLAALSPAIMRAELATTNVVLSGAGVAAIFLVSGLSQVLWARCDDTAAFMVGAVGMVLSLGLLAAAVAEPSVPLFMVATAAGGASVGALFMSTLSRVNLASTDEERGRVTATYFFVTFLGLVLPVILTGVVADAIGLGSATALFAGVVGGVIITATALTVLPPNASERES